MAEELLSLKWNNHQSHFVDILTFLREQEIFIDATLACGGKLYPAHKFVLSTCSDYFKQMFTKNPNKHPIVFMKDVSCRDLEALLDFMYNGEVNVPQSSLGSLIKTAEGLQIKGLAVPDDPPISNKREAALLRDRRELKTVRDNSYSPSPKRLRGRDKSPPLYSSRSKSPNSLPLHPSTTAAVASLAAVVSAEANAAAADEDSRTSAISDHSAAHVAGNSTAAKPNANSHLNSEDSASLSDNISRVSNRDPSPGPSGLKNILLHSKEEELDIKQEDVVDLGDAEGDWGGGDDGRDESLDDGGGGDSLTSENNAPNFSDVLGPPSDGSLNTSGDRAMRIDGGGVAVMVTASQSLSNSVASSVVEGGFDSRIFSTDEHMMTVAATTYTQSRSGSASPPLTSSATLAMDVSPSVYRFLLESSGGSTSSVHRATKFCPSPSMSSSVSISTNLSASREGVDEQHHHRPFPCKFCEARFKKKQHLQNHERIHTGEKYVCILCGQGFSRLHILKHHVSRKHNVTDGITSPTPSSSSMIQHN